VLFAVEIAVCVRCKHGYVWGFFFWADVVGTMSLFFDIPWLNPLGTGNAGEATILRSSRTARIGARAARLMRLQRVVKVLRIVRVIKLAKAAHMARYFCRRGGSKDGNDEAQTDAQKSLESASHVSTELSDMLSKRVALLVMLMVISMPFLLAEPSDPHQTRVFALRSVASMREQGMRPSWAEVSELFEFFGATAEQPFRLVLAGLSVFKTAGLTGNATDTVYERVRVGSNATAPHARCCYGCGGSHVATVDACTETFARKKTNVTYIYQHPDMAESRLECDQTQSVVRDPQARGCQRRDKGVARGGIHDRRRPPHAHSGGARCSVDQAAQEKGRIVGGVQRRSGERHAFGPGIPRRTGR
jgi:hypothetical protein